VTTPVNRVLPRLWISDIESARETARDFDTIVTACQDSIEDSIGEDVTYQQYDLADGPQDTAGGRCDYELFRSTAQAVRSARLDEHDTLVHCHLGVSRSASVVIAVIGATENRDYETARQLVAAERPEIDPKDTLADFARRYIEEFGED
jgi:Dual specificity phosphatase, catalytic domain.